MEILLNQIKHGMEPYWFITYHYRDNKTKEDEIILDVKDIKNKLRRIIYQNRDTSIIELASSNTLEWYLSMRDHVLAQISFTLT